MSETGTCTSCEKRIVEVDGHWQHEDAAVFFNSLLGGDMSRSGYSDDIDDQLQFGRWRAQVKSAIRGKRGQAFLRELAQAMDAMPEKELITDELIDAQGSCCTIGVVCKARGLDVSTVDVEAPEQVGDLVGIARQLAAEIEYENDDSYGSETPEQRWKRMRKWVDAQIISST